MTSSADAVTVIGAGPAGLAATVEAARAGLSVTLVDGEARVGGQYWRHRVAGLSADADLHHDVTTYVELEAALAGLIRRGLVTYLPSHQVWSVRVDADGCVVYAIDRTDPLHPSERTVTSQYLILAAGGYDRQVPFPGWTVPGVMTVGAAQSLLKGSGVAVGPRVLVAGTGPFLLPVATSLAERGATVVGVYEANQPLRWLRQLPAVAALPSKIAEAGRYAITLARRRVPVRNRSVVLAAHGVDRLTAVTVARLDRHGAVKPGTRRRIDVDVLAVGYGFCVQVELARQAGCELTGTSVAGGAIAVLVDREQRTSVPRVFAAGETTGVAGAQSALVEATLAGAALARACGREPHSSPNALNRLATRRDRLRRFAAAMHAVYPAGSSWIDGLEPETTVCRCEEVTAADINTALADGAADVRTVRMLSRAGMGWCQGRQCGYAVSCLVARHTGRPVDLFSGGSRPVATPVPLGVIAAGHAPLAQERPDQELPTKEGT